MYAVIFSLLHRDFRTALLVMYWHHVGYSVDSIPVPHSVGPSSLLYTALTAAS